MENTWSIFRLEKRRQLGFKCLIFQVEEFNLNSRMSFFVFVSSFRPNLLHLGKLSDVKNFDNSLWPEPSREAILATPGKWEIQISFFWGMGTHV